MFYGTADNFVVK